MFDQMGNHLACCIYFLPGLFCYTKQDLQHVRTANLGSRAVCLQHVKLAPFLECAVDAILDLYESQQQIAKQ